MKTRNFVFTVNNFTEENVQELLKLESEVDYMIVGEEIGESGTPHLQGYVRFKSQRSIAGIVKVLPGHIEVAGGSPMSNFNYCSKDGKFWELGQRPKGKGKRTDLDEIKALVKEPGTTLEKIYEVAQGYQAFRMGEIGIGIYTPKRNWPMVVEWYWGPTGSGKTRKAVDGNPEAWVSGRDLKWWNGYERQETVIFDDFRADFCKFHELLRILDRYPYRVEVKGGSRELVARKIIITCPKNPRDVYKTREDIDQLLRRITLVERFGSMDHGSEVGGNSIPLPFDPSGLTFL